MKGNMIEDSLLKYYVSIIAAMCIYSCAKACGMPNCSTQHMYKAMHAMASPRVKVEAIWNNGEHKWLNADTFNEAVYERDFHWHGRGIQISRKDLETSTRIVD